MCYLIQYGMHTFYNTIERIVYNKRYYKNVKDTEFKEFMIIRCILV